MSKKLIEAGADISYAVKNMELLMIMMQQTAEMEEKLLLHKRLKDIFTEENDDLKTYIELYGKYENLKNQLHEENENLKNQLHEENENLKNQLYEEDESLKNQLYEEDESLKNQLYEEDKNSKMYGDERSRTALRLNKQLTFLGLRQKL